MFRLIYRQLLYEPMRMGLTVIAIAAVVAVILILEGFNEGIIEQLRYAVTDRDADLIVTQAGVSNMIATRSSLRQFSRRDVEAIEGVAVAHPLTGIPVIYEQGGLRTPIFLWIFDERGGPREFVAGNNIQNPRDIVIDHSLAKKYALQVGDPLVVSDFEFRVSGIANAAAAFFTSFAFASYDDLIDFYFESDIAGDISTLPLVSFLLVKLEPGVDRSVVAEGIEAGVNDADVFFPEVLAEQDAELGRTFFGPIMQLLISVGYLIGVLVTAIIMFSAVNVRRHEFGVLKALGFSHLFLSASVVVEALVYALAAIPIGIALASLVSQLIEVLMPLYLILPTEAGPVLRTATACIVFAVVGALVPIRLIRRVDPSVVFRS